MPSLSEQLLDGAGRQGAEMTEKRLQAPGHGSGVLGALPPGWAGPAASAGPCWFPGQSYIGAEGPSA